MTGKYSKVGQKFINHNKVIAVIPTRLKSERLSGKVLIPLNGKPCLQRIVERLRKCEQIDDIIIAVAGHKQNKPILDFCYEKLKVTSMRGSADDVYGRVLKAGQLMYAKYIIDITADCPLVDPTHIDHMIKNIKKKNLDFVCNTVPRSWPDGFDVQIFKTSIMEQLDPLITDPVHRLHVGWNILNYKHLLEKGRLKVGSFKAPPDYNFPHWGLTLDEEQDRILLDKIFCYFDKQKKLKFSAENIIDYLKLNPELLEINLSVVRNIPGQG